MSTFNIWGLVETAISGMGIKYAADKFKAESGDPLPDEFIVYFLVSAPPDSFADDVESQRSYKVQVNYFNRAGLGSMPDIDSAMQAQGFIKGNLIPLPVDPDSGHFGLGTEYVITI